MDDDGQGDKPWRLAAERQFVDEAERVVVLSGAGISKESGIQEFRGPQGVWTKNTEAEKMATIQHYLADAEVRSWRMPVGDEAYQGIWARRYWTDDAKVKKSAPELFNKGHG